MKRPRIRNLISNDGLTQPARFLEELQPQFVDIDDRTLLDLLTFAWKYSDHLLFFEAAETGRGEQVLPNGSWQQLLRHEQLFYLALIGGRTPVQYSRDFENAIGSLDPANDSEQQWTDKMVRAFAAVIDLCAEVHRWSRRLPVGSKGARDLKIYVGQLTPKVERLLALYNLKIYDGRLWETIRSRLPDWQIDPDPPVPDGTLLVDKPYVTALRHIFGEVQTIYASIVNNARQIIETLLGQDAHQAHVGLLLAFLKLLEHNRAHLNTLTGRHLDFYLRDILKLEPKTRLPDAVNLTFTLAKGVDRHRLAAGTTFKGGKNEDNRERLYDLKHELALSRAVVADLKNLFVAADPRTVHAAAKADSLDGAGEALPEDNPKWPGFGRPDYPLAETGFAVASPLLRLGQGERAVTLTFRLNDVGPLETEYAQAFESATADPVPLPDVFTARVSTAKGWHPCTPGVSVDRKEKALVLAFAFDMNVPAIVDYDAEKLADPVPLPAAWPVFRLVLDQGGHPRAYKALSQLRAIELTLGIEVDNVRDLVLANDAARLKADKPFMPFGSQPRVGSTFYVGDAETFAKPLTRLSLSWQWVDPPANLETHYQNYTDDEFQFTADVELRENYNWDHALKENEALGVVADPDSYKKVAGWSVDRLDQIRQSVDRMAPGDLKDLQQGVGGASLQGLGLGKDDQKALEKRFVIGRRNVELKSGRPQAKSAAAAGRVEDKAGAAAAAAIEAAKIAQPQFFDTFSFPVSGYDAALEAEPFTRYSESLRQGFIRWRLKTPAFAFGHKGYPKLHSQAVAAALSSSDPDPSLLETLQLPYTPVFENLQLSYRAEKTFSLTSADSHLQMLRLLPFGYSGSDPGDLIADYPSEGYLYIGLADLTPPQNLSLLIQLAEGSGDPFKTAPRSVTWSCLTPTGWKDVARADILRDGTLGFLQSGIIELALPKSMTDTHPELPPGKHWLRVAVSDNTAALHDVLAVTAQAGVAVYRDQGHSAKHLATALVAGSVSKMQVRDTALKSVSQPFASYGGREAESDSEFHTRSSERLRHKDRAVALWDYEHLVLERFPEVHKVKCLNHTCPASEFAPGNVTLVLVPDLRNRNSRYPLRPAVPQSVLEAVRRFVRKRCSAHLSIHVVNPFYERIAIGGRVHFLPGFDQGIYQKQLHRDITDGLTPWLRGEKDIHFGGRIHGSVILNLVEELPYIDYLSAFTVTHYAGPDDTAGQQVDEVIATGGRSILVSNDSHTIQGVSAQ